MTRPDDIVGYTYKADVFCPRHIAGELASHGAPVTPGELDYPEAAETMLNELAASWRVAGHPPIDREDERSFDSDYFPKVVFRDSASEGGDGLGDRCGKCHEYLDESAPGAQAYALGVDAANAAASWTCDGNTDERVALCILALLDDGDPEAENYLPNEPNLSGEWADATTAQSLAQEILGTWQGGPGEETREDLEQALADEWERGVSDTFEAACEAELRKVVGR